MAKDRKWDISLGFFALGLRMPLLGSWEASEHGPLWRLGSWAGPVGTVVWEEAQMGGPRHLTRPPTPCLKHAKEHDQRHYDRTSSMASCCRIESVLQDFREEVVWVPAKARQVLRRWWDSYPELYWKPRVGQIVEGCENQAMTSLCSERRVCLEVNGFPQLETLHAPGWGLW